MKKGYLKPEGIEPLENDIINSPRMISGRSYLPWEVFSYLGFATIMRRFLPGDSHMNLNLDGPEQGPLFEYAVAAARKRTSIEFDNLRHLLSPQELGDFIGKPNRYDVTSSGNVNQAERAQ